MEVCSDLFLPRLPLDVCHPEASTSSAGAGLGSARSFGGLPYCHAQDTVKVQTTIRGESVLLEWHCAACKAEWPVRRKNEQASA